MRLILPKAKMYTLLVCFFALYLCGANGLVPNCGDLSGTWTNELGSRMIVDHDVATNLITGQFKTAVESTTGAAKTASSVTGLSIPVKDGAVVSFSVLFNNGSSLTVWVGQCILCDGKEYIYTTYIFRRYVQEKENRWFSTAINQNTFWRESTEKAQLFRANVNYSRGVPDINDLETILEDSRIAGNWDSTTAGKIEFKSPNLEKLVQGNYNEQVLTGKIYAQDDFTAIGFVSASPKERQVRSWAGYVYEKDVSDKPSLETSWLEHTFTSNCKAPRKLVRFGMDNFIRVQEYSQHPASNNETFLEKIRNFFKSLF